MTTIKQASSQLVRAVGEIRMVIAMSDLDDKTRCMVLDSLTAIEDVAGWLSKLSG